MHLVPRRLKAQQLIHDARLRELRESAFVFQIRKQITANTNAALQRNQEAQRQAHQRARAERANSPTGTKLAQQCYDWHRAYEQLKSETALQQKNRHCSSYEHFLETGSVKLDMTIRPGK